MSSIRQKDSTSAPDVVVKQNQRFHYGRYQVVNQLAIGNLSQVYQAYDHQDHMLVAMKFPRFHNLRYYEFIHRERWMLEQVRHRNIVELLNFGIQGFMPYIVLENISGPTLREHVDGNDKQVIGWRKASEIGIKIAEALSMSHTKNVYHCDIKPSNIILVDSIMPKVIDFGLAQSPLYTPHYDIDCGEILGTLYFASPEQCEGKDLDQQSDIYSLGATLFFSVMGYAPADKKAVYVVPSEAGTEVRRVFTSSGDENTKASAFAGIRMTDIPTPFVELLESMLKADKAQRLPTVMEFIYGIRKAERQIRSKNDD